MRGSRKGDAATVGLSVGESDLKQYHHVDRYFTIHHPLDWKLIREIKDGGVFYCFTPEVDKAKIDDVEVAVTVRLMVPDANSALAGKDPVALLRHLLPRFPARRTGSCSRGVTCSREAGAIEGEHVELQRVAEEQDRKKYAREMYVALDHGMYFFVTTGAPQEKLTAFDAVFTQVIEHSEFGHAAVAARGDNQQANEIIDSVQAIGCLHRDEKTQTPGPGGQGTGFIIPEKWLCGDQHPVAVRLDDV